MKAARTLSVLCAVAGLLVFGVQRGLPTTYQAQPSPEAQRRFENALSVLPPTSQHHFAAVNPAWQRSEGYWRLRSDAFVGVDKPSAWEKKTLYWSESYVDPAEDHPKHEVKNFFYYPNGQLFREIDDTFTQNFCRKFLSDGSFESFIHWRDHKWVAGVAIDPKTGAESHFSDGAGAYTIHNLVGIAETYWYQDGDNFLHVDREGSRRKQVWLTIGNDELFVTKEGESLRLPGEEWTRKAGETPVCNDVFYGPKTDTPKMPMMWMGPTDRQQLEMQRLQAAWKTIYSNQRRPDLLKRFADVMTAAGQSWHSLDLEFVRDDAPWPDR